VALEVKVEKLEGNLVALEVEVPQEEVQKAIKRAYKKVANQVKIPGFRKGKVPPEVIDLKVGKEVVLQEALDELLNASYFRAVAENKVKVIAEPEVEIIQFEEEKPLVYRAKVEVKPEIELPPYDTVSVEKQQVGVTEDEINEQLEKLRQRFAKLETKSVGVAEQGDYALITFDGFIDGQKEERASMQDFLVELGSQTLMPDFEKHLYGTKAGDIKRFSVRFPEDHHEPRIAGKDVEFSVIVKEIKKKIVPDLTDEFAKEIGGFENLDSLKELLRERIKEVKEQQAEVDFQNELLKKYVEQVSVEVPQKLIEKEIDQMVVELAYDLAQQGVKLEDYLNYVQLTTEKLRESMKEDAEKRIKTKLVLETIAEKEGIEVTEEDIEHEIKHLAERWQATPEEVRKLLEDRNEMDLLEYDILLGKAFRALVDRYKESLGEEKPEAESVPEKAGETEDTEAGGNQEEKSEDNEDKSE
jgi:trigger factor